MVCFCGHLLNFQFAIQNLFSRCFLMHLILFVCFVALRPKSTAMVMAGPNIGHLTLET